MLSGGTERISGEARPDRLTLMHLPRYSTPKFIFPEKKEDHIMKLKHAVGLVGLCLFLILVAWPGLARAQESQKVYTLQGSIAEAIKNSYKLKAKQEKVDQAYSFRNQARADFFPKLGMDYSYTRLSLPQSVIPRTLTSFYVPFQSQENYQWTGTIRQPIFTGFALTSSFRLAELGIDRSELEYQLETLDLALNVKQAYFNILGADKVVSVAEKDVETRTWTVKVARSFFDVGMIPINDVLKAEVELANAEQNLVKARNGAAVARASFNIVLARPVNEPVEVEDILTYRPVKGEYEEYVEKALAIRPEIKILDVGILQADQQIRLAKSKYYPEVDLNWQYFRQGESPFPNDDHFANNDTWQITAVMSWTFWEWGKTYYAGREKESLRRELIQTKSDSEDQIRLQVQDAILAIATAEKNIPTTQKAVSQGEENLRVNEERYKAQVSTITDLLDAQTLLAQARVNYYQALYDWNLARARLERAMGTY
jgi:outer membrane protein